MGNHSVGPEKQKQNDRKENDMQNLKNERGQGLVEYSLIVALMGVLAITAVNSLSTKTQSGFDAATRKLGTEFAKIGG